MCGLLPTDRDWCLLAAKSLELEEVAPSIAWHDPVPNTMESKPLPTRKGSLPFQRSCRPEKHMAQTSAQLPGGSGLLAHHPCCSTIAKQLGYPCRHARQRKHQQPVHCVHCGLGCPQDMHGGNKVSDQSQVDSCFAQTKLLPVWLTAWLGPKMAAA